MKHIKEYNNKYFFIDDMSVVDIIKKIGYELTAKYLSKLLEGKYVTFVNSIIAKGDLAYRNTNSGTVDKIFYIDTSGFIIARINGDIYSDLVINRSKIECDEELDYDRASMVLDIEKYNL